VPSEADVDRESRRLAIGGAAGGGEKTPSGQRLIPLPSQVREVIATQGQTVNRASSAFGAFVTLILTIAKSKALAAPDGGGSSSTSVGSDDALLVTGTVTGPIGGGTKGSSRLLTLGPFMTLILTLRCRHSDSEGVCRHTASLSEREAESATATQGASRTVTGCSFVGR